MDSLARRQERRRFQKAAKAAKVAARTSLPGPCAEDSAGPPEVDAGTTLHAPSRVDGKAGKRRHVADGPGAAKFPLHDLLTIPGLEARKKRRSREADDVDGAVPPLEVPSSSSAAAADARTLPAPTGHHPEGSIHIGTTIAPAPARLQQYKHKLDGARFRWLNEQLYTRTGHESLEDFRSNPELFQLVRDSQLYA